MTVSELETILRKLDEINSDPLSNEYEREVKYNNLVQRLSPEERRLVGEAQSGYQYLSVVQQCGEE